jgi:NADH-quinone oxidoreductase subunit L
MTHAFFKALLFLCSGSVIHAMAGEQDMRRMGNLRKYMPVTYVTMMIGTLAIAGMPPLSGFFSKDEILLKAFLANKVIWTLAVLTALMTAFYMFRLMSMTFFGDYRGPVWGHSHGHDAPAHAHDAGHGHGDPDQAHDDDAGHGHGHGEWHGPHESPNAMTYPLMALAIGAIVAGFVGVPHVLKGNNAIESFLEPSFTAHAAAHAPAAAHAGEHAAPAEEPAAAGAHGDAAEHGAAAEGHGGEGAHASAGLELGLMAFSVAIGLIGIFAAYRFYVTDPSIAAGLGEKLAGPHRLLYNKYYVDEIYDATVIGGTMASARGLWTVDKKVVDGAVNGTGSLTVIASWLSGLTDKSVVDGLVNLVARVAEELSFMFRRLQTGLIQNYALLMLFGVFAFVTVYLFAR